MNAGDGAGGLNQANALKKWTHANKYANTAQYAAARNDKHGNLLKKRTRNVNSHPV